jgi:hypothetical protein
MLAVSVHPLTLVQINLYEPAAVNPVMVVAGFAAVVIMELPGLPTNAVHVPVPVAAIVAEPPGSNTQLTV